MEETLSGRVAIVTGGSRGIGQAIVLKLVAAGASVVIGGISDTSRTHSLVLEAGGSEERLLSIKTDVTKVEEVNRLVKSTIDHFGKVDVLVNNAGITRDALLLRMKDDDWDAVLDTNLKGAFLCTRAVLVHMVRSRWGRIVNISSVVGLIGNPGQANYSAAKAGLIGLTKTTAREVASRGITVNAVAPGFIDTDMTRGLSDQVKERLQGLIPQKRFGTPEDVAHVVEFLTSPKSSYITGQVVGVNGGMFMA
ncbi:MAG: 3-oxoacyl-[acyl-carrier-protein] reductase [Chloroflexi bacterium]|nr:3-oxoacyl-[acyl-carrier-protein] reductase [Chloroflexota bacterium]